MIVKLVLKDKDGKEYNKEIKIKFTQSEVQEIQETLETKKVIVNNTSTTSSNSRITSDHLVIPSQVFNKLLKQKMRS